MQLYGLILVSQDRDNPNFSDFSDISYRTSYNTNLDKIYKNSRFYVYNKSQFWTFVK